VDWAVYGALIAGFAAVVAAAAYLVVQALKGWRSFKRLRRHTAKELARLAEVADATAASAARASDQSRFNASSARLRVALAELAVLRSALDEATDAVGRIVAVYPRK
jgi:hypothetical protein